MISTSAAEIAIVETSVTNIKDPAAIGEILKGQTVDFVILGIAMNLEKMAALGRIVESLTTIRKRNGEMTNLT